MDHRDAIKRAFDEYFASYRITLPTECLDRPAGAFEQNGWTVQYQRAGEFLECFASHRMTNDRLYRIYADGRVELVDSSMNGLNPEHDRRFHAEIRRRGYQ